MNRLHLGRATVAVLVPLLFCVLVPTANAAAPPKGDYGCTFTSLSGTFYAGTLNIVGKSAYKVNDKKRGKFRAKGKRLTFVTGDYRTLYFGKWSTIDGVYGRSHVIKLYGKKDREEKLVCTNSVD
jgi:hypothetical protein